VPTLTHTLSIVPVRVFESLARILLVGEFDHPGRGVVNLQGGVVKIEAFFEEALQCPPLGVAVLVFCDQPVARAGRSRGS
jgi:hypothetical protein